MKNLLIGGVLGLVCATAAAQDAATVPVPQPAPAPLATDSVATQLDEVQVTAQRKVSTVQETPISIEAFNAEKLSLRGISGLDGLATQVPSLTIEPFPTHNATLRIAIRGIVNNDAQVTQDPAVGVYLDGVYIARAVGLAIDTADLERIEVLRGPQGTLYGRNTTGGAVNLVTRRPQPGLFSLQQSLTLADRHQALARTMLNLPLGDSFALKLAAIGNQRDGWVQNSGPGGDFGDRHERALRADARWLAADWLTADYSYDRTDTQYFNYMFQAVLLPQTNHGQAELFKPFAVQNTVYSSQRLDTLATAMPLDPSGSHIQGHALVLTAPLGAAELKYIGAYRRLTDDEYTDLSGGNGSPDFRVDTEAYDGPSATLANGGPVGAMTPQVFQRQWSHELQLSGKFDDGAVEFIAGAFHFLEKGGENGRPLHHILNTELDPQQAQPYFSLV
ncbi:MAG TPA: TonB-dependent receptor, partial [Nevskiaceae bacterium]|nr:TonB-dependent receptor [Nevskiaceae bacterium]